jgi:hypothetical protein
MKSSSADVRFAMLSSAALVTCAYRVFRAESESMSAALVGWAVGLCVWLWLFLLSSLLRGPRSLARLGHALFFALFVPLVVIDLAYTFFFDTALERRLSLLDAGGAGVAYFFEHVLPSEGVYTMLALALAVIAGGLLVRRAALTWPRKLTVLTAGLLSLLTFVSAVQAERVAHPLADVCADLNELLTTTHVTPSARKPGRFATATLDRSITPWPGALDTPFKKVIVFVLESITAQGFDQERAALSPTTFARAAAPHLHAYTRYFTGNQDSRTGMLGMLSARLNPFEAYTDEDVAAYETLARGPSLVERMNRLGYTSAFAVSQLELELVVKDLPWQRIIHLSEAEREAADQKYECLNPYEFEHSCEDLALLPRVLEFLDANERAFLYQEFIWGHAWQYNAALQQTNAQYYSGYIDAVIAHLRARGELDDTLLVVVSDHGPREHERTTDPETYRIPLWFYSSRFTPREDPGLRSHLDFAELLRAELTQASPPPPNPFVLITGPTSSSLWAAVTERDDFMLVKSRGDVHLLVYHANVAGQGVNPALDPRAPADLLRVRLDYRRAFSSAPNPSR